MARRRLEHIVTEEQMERVAREHAREAALQLDQIVGHVGTVMGGLQLGEKRLDGTSLVDHDKILKAIETLHLLLEYDRH